VDGQGKRGEHKRNHADKKVRLSQGKVRKDKDERSGPSHSPRLTVFWSHRQHEHALSSRKHTLHKSMHTTLLQWHVQGVHFRCKNQTQRLQVSAEHCPGRSPDSSLHLAVASTSGDP